MKDNSQFSSHIDFPQMDSRIDLGYGKTKKRFSKNIKFRSSYPYQLTSAEQEELQQIRMAKNSEETEGLKKKINSLILKKVYKNDSLSKKGSNPFYFVGAATKLGENLKTSKINKSPYFTKQPNPELVTWPGTIGSSFSHFRTKTRPTGSKKGWSSGVRRGKKKVDDFFDFLSDELPYDETLRMYIRKLLQKDNKNMEFY